MSNAKVSPPDPFIMNCKMMFNDVCRMQDQVRRMWACAESSDDFTLIEWIEIQLANVGAELRHRLNE